MTARYNKLYEESAYGLPEAAAYLKLLYETLRYWLTGFSARPSDGDRRASYLVMDGESITIRRVEYDVESEANELLRSGLPHAAWLSRVLLAGKYCPPE